MSSYARSGEWSRFLRRLAPLGAVAFLAALGSGLLPVLAAPGDSPEEAIPIGSEGRFAGTVPAGEERWYRFIYDGDNEPAEIRVDYLPADSNRFDFNLYTGSPGSLRREGTTPTREGNSLVAQFSDDDRTEVFIELTNEHTDGRVVSFAGRIDPTRVVAALPTGTATPAPGPVAGAPADAITVGEDGLFQGALAPLDRVWYRFFYNNPGGDAVIRVAVAPGTEEVTMNLYTGPDPNSLTQQGGEPTRSGDTLTRRVNLATSQFVYFTIVNNKDANPIIYAGRVTPAGAPPTPVPTITPTLTATPLPAATPVATTTPQPAPPMPHDNRYFFPTRFRVDNDQIWSFFQSRGGIDTFGYPVSRTFDFLGCPVQVFQRLIIQICPGQAPALINLLDPEIFPYTRVNGSVFPGPDEDIKNATPRVGTPEYDRILDFVRSVVPNEWQGQPVNFQRTFFETGGLETWGAPISNPQRDPTNANFVYQRFQRGIMHFDATTGVTRGILLADYLKAIITGQNVPADLREQARGSRYFEQYCPGAPGWLCRPNELPATNLIFAFEQG